MNYTELYHSYNYFLIFRIKNVNLDKEKEQEISTKKKEARKQKLLEKNNISRQEKKRKKKLELLGKPY